MIRNRLNGEFYLGSATSLINRWQQHKYLLREGRHHSLHLQNAWNKYGPDAFVFEVLTECEHIRSVEQWCLDHMECHYNVSRIASAIEYTDEVRSKISAKTRARYIVRDGKTLRELALEHGQPHDLVYTRMQRGMTLDEALTAPRQAHKTTAGAVKHPYHGRMLSLSEIARETGWSLNSLIRRVKFGMTAQQAGDMTKEQAEAWRLRKHEGWNERYQIQAA